MEGALGLIRESRPAAAPNAGFMRQLRDFEASLGRAGGTPRRSLDAAAGGGYAPGESCDPGGSWCEEWGRKAAPLHMAPSSPRRVDAATAAPYPFDDRASLRSSSDYGSICAPSPQSSRGDCTPLNAAAPIPCWRVPEFSLVTGFESPPSSPEWGPFGPPAARRAQPTAFAAAAPSLWLCQDTSDPTR